MKSLLCVVHVVLDGDAVRLGCGGRPVWVSHLLFVTARVGELVLVTCQGLGSCCVWICLHLVICFALAS